MAHFNNFLQVKHHPLMLLTAVDLNKILLDYYCSVQPQKNSEKIDEKYSVQSMKCMQAALNRYFRTTRGIDIVNDQEFV